MMEHRSISARDEKESTKESTISSTESVGTMNVEEARRVFIRDQNAAGDLGKSMLGRLGEKVKSSLFGVREGSAAENAFRISKSNMRMSKPDMKRGMTLASLSLGAPAETESTSSEKPPKDPDVLFKKQVYKVYLSLFYGIGLLGTALYDFRGVYDEWETEGIPDKWHTGIIYSHIASFYVLITGFIVANETHQYECQKYAFLSLFVNILAFILRLVYELSFMDFVPVVYFAPEP